MRRIVDIPLSFIDILAICLTAIGFIPAPAVVAVEATSISPNLPTCSVDTLAVDANSLTTVGNSSLMTESILPAAAICTDSLIAGRYTGWMRVVWMVKDWKDKGGDKQLMERIAGINL
jgi:hypothetical protein